MRHRIGLLLLAVAASAAADPLDDFCRRVERSTNALADFTTTKCLPTAGTKKGSNSFLIISEKPVFSNEKSKKAWLMVACAAAGSELNKSSIVRADELWFSDVARTKERVAFAAPAATCKTLQAKASGGSIGLEQFYSTLSAQLVQKGAR